MSAKQNPLLNMQQVGRTGAPRDVQGVFGHGRYSGVFRTNKAWCLAPSFCVGPRQQSVAKSKLFQSSCTQAWENATLESVLVSRNFGSGSGGACSISTSLCAQRLRSGIRGSHSITRVHCENWLHGERHKTRQYHVGSVRL